MSMYYVAVEVHKVDAPTLRKADRDSEKLTVCIIDNLIFQVPKSELIGFWYNLLGDWTHCPIHI